MRQDHKKLLVALVVCLLLVAAGTLVMAQSSARFDLSWHIIGNGGGVSSSASYRVHGTIGQSVASQPTAGSASYRASSGYWFVDTGMSVYLPALLKN
jgi:hypothetical protein